jgi:hypothetical protein
MKERDSMILYRSFYEAIIELPEANQLEIMKAIFEYGFDGVEPNLSGLSKTIWILIKPNLEANRRKWENGSKPKQKQTGSKTEAKPKQEESKTEGNVYVDVDVDVEEDKEEEKEQDGNRAKNRRFVAPTIQEISEYLKSKHPSVPQNRIDALATKFWSHYENKNWSYGKGQKMKDWRLAFGQWQETIAKDLYQSSSPPQQSINSPVKHKVEYYNVRWPDNVKICTEEQLEQIRQGNPEETFEVVRKFKY